MVPLVAMVRHARDLGTPDAVRLAVSARTDGRAALRRGARRPRGAVIAVTREATPVRAAGRLTAAEVLAVLPPSGPCFVCGSAVFAEAATDLLLGGGVETGRIRVERFGPSG